MQSPGSNQEYASRFEAQAASILDADHFLAPEQPVFVVRSPGRLDVMGGNVDYTGGMVLQSLLREAVWVASQARADETVRIFNPGVARFGWNTYFELDFANLTDKSCLQKTCGDESTFWGRYVLGAVYFLQSVLSDEHPHVDNCSRTGLDLFISSDLPPNKGVSSSAALTVATLKAVATAWHIDLNGVALATAAQWVENVVAGAACGIMDQAAIVLGRKDYLLPLLCQPCIPSPLIRLPAGLRIWGIDSTMPRSTTGAPYEVARVAAFMGYRMICDRERLDITKDPTSKISRWTEARWHGYLSNVALSEFRARYERWLPEIMSGNEYLTHYGEHIDPFTAIDPEANYPVRAAVRYAIEENLRVQMVRRLFDGAMRTNSDMRLLGELFRQSHHAYAECGLGSPACDNLVERARDAGIPAAKMTGGGGGGVVALLGYAEDHTKVRAIAEAYAADCGKTPHVFEGSSDGVDAFGVCMLQPTRTWSLR